MNGLTFDEASHTYRYNGVVVPNVTRIIGHLTDYSHIPISRLATLQAEGRAVHHMVELACQGRLDLKRLPEWLLPHHTAWLRFLDDTGFEPWLSEQMGYHPKLKYAGTLDLFGEFRRMPKIKGPALLDVKRSFYAGPAIGLQLSGYELLLRADRALPRTKYRGALRLGGDGKWKVEEFDDRDDEAAFLACLQQLQWKRKHYPNKEA